MNRQARKRIAYVQQELVSNIGSPFIVTTGWTPSSNSTATIVAGAIRLTHTTASVKSITSPISCIIGKQYRVKTNISARTLTGNASLGVGTSAGNPTNVASKIISSTAAPIRGGADLIFTATQTTHYVSISTSSSALSTETIDFDSFSAKEYVG